MAVAEPAVREVLGSSMHEQLRIMAYGLTNNQ